MSGPSSTNRNKASPSPADATRSLAQRVGAQANRLRFVLWGGFLGLLTVGLMVLALATGSDASYSVRSAERGQTTGPASKHAYAYQGLARLLQAERMGGASISGNSPLGNVGLRILLEPQLTSGDQDTRLAFRAFLTQSDVPVLLVPHLRNSTDRRLRLLPGGFLTAPLDKLTVGSKRAINADLGFRRGVKMDKGITEGRSLGASVAVEDLVSFDGLWTGAETVRVDGHVVLYRQTIRGTQVYFLSDTDLMNNAGLRRAENADFALALLEDIKAPGAVVFDHRDIRLGSSGGGFSLIQRLFEWPLGILTGSLLALGLLLFWVAFGRFGPMLRDPAHLEAGKDVALDAAVAMLVGTGNNREVLRRYLDGQTRQLAARLGGPRTGDLARLRGWLDAVAERRGVAESLRLSPVSDRLRASTDTLSNSQAAGAATTIHAFRKALIHDT